MDQWAQNMELVLKRVPHATCGHDGKGEVWVKTVYGKVKTEGGGRPMPYHQHELHFFYAGKDAAPIAVDEKEMKKGAKSRAAKAPGQKRKRVSAPAKRPDWVEGTLYHVRALPGEAVSPETAPRSRLDLRLDAGEQRWIQLDDENGVSKGAIEL